MYSKILILKFPKDEATKPVVCRLAKKFNLEFNILNATISPGKEGLMVLELSGDKKDFDSGVKFLKKSNISVKTPEQEVERDEDKCFHCGACTSVCPTLALHISRPSMEVVFDKEKCSICELCIMACPVKAMKIFPKSEIFFDEKQ